MDQILLENNLTWAYVLKGVEIALFWSKMAFVGTENSGFEALFAF